MQCIVDPYKQNEAVIDALHRRPDEDFDSFCEALIETKQKHIVYDYLKPGSKPDTIPEGMTYILQLLKKTTTAVFW